MTVGSPDDPTGSGNHVSDGEFEELKETNRALAVNVRSLANSLDIVNELQVKQRESERAIEAQRQLTLARDRRVRHAIISTTMSAAVIAIIAAAIVYLSLLVHVNSLLDQQRALGRQNCISRNEGVVLSAAREEALARLAPSAAEKAIHLRSASGLRAGLLDCDRR